MHILRRIMPIRLTINSMPLRLVNPLRQAPFLRRTINSTPNSINNTNNSMLLRYRLKVPSRSWARSRICQQPRRRLLKG